MPDIEDVLEDAQREIRSIGDNVKSLKDNMETKGRFVATARRSRSFRDNTSCTSMSAVSMPTPITA